MEGSEEVVNENAFNNVIPLRARVFISCGQRKDSDETKIAQDIASKLTTMGFDPYVAVMEQSPRGVKENIFARLSESEYFLFIDFKRDRLCQLESGELKDTNSHRGSLFANQELAIASYLDIPCITFQEQGIRQLDGILGFVQANCITFVDRNDLQNKVETIVSQKVEKGDWNPRWRNELSLEAPVSAPNILSKETGQSIDWYHLPVKNNHRNRYARNCLVYVLRIMDTVNRKEIYSPNVELLWSGAVEAQPKHVLPQKAAKVYAFFVNHDKSIIEFLEAPSRSTEPEYQIPDLKAGSYLITYTVISENFNQVTRTYKLDFGGRYDSVTFAPYDGSSPNE
ncbi:MAG: hypothetical protein HYX90_04085 [Chloroflexi bacterium]|nr:hypothetical protein [Chloroflexota bacterium]